MRACHFIFVSLNLQGVPLQLNIIVIQQNLK